MYIRTEIETSLCLECGEYRAFLIVLECYCKVRSWLCKCCQITSTCSTCGYSNKTKA